MAVQKEQRVEAVERALTILNAFTDSDSRLTLNQIAAKTGFYPSTILRLAGSLERFGYINREPDGRFRLGSTLYRLGNQYQRTFNLAEYVRPVLRKLVEVTEETAAFYIKDGDRRICLYRHHADRIFRHYLEEGASLSLDKGATARILMAFSGEPGVFYDDIRGKGYYISLGERDPDTGAIGVPVFGVGNNLVGALGLTVQMQRFTAEAQSQQLEVLMSEARDLSIRLGSTQGFSNR
ncbi:MULTISPECIES: IclR family transcriptional regulator [Agrobacterium]|uniref:DNA-binding IclR family transcriptional regulator n=1 Tax=Agrobacterium tumefaciens TaxID=358 RepID=A0AAW8M3N6_AGRTU|nr:MULTISPECIES: IclR family transcriptional regulator [Agrobacterium]MBP2511710.1 DNA-binding IclR family transcriptional regulator [Agrobacterium tumefaciens]MBP2520872.1 DNA-binding IclR family transcriptional regulator [Agrobacterium tumefaciens]MBP2537565.1 DNA-binding IclR family transcriptional regulator [Agrobacterium tumefaciens]MBP2542766.1 DNA-binding IclR family transcriptional regulator [Agrobacterium tumefaciens]MBP2568813.1 DNA-binding IclR family transcriptional regulator [Agro